MTFDLQLFDAHAAMTRARLNRRRKREQAAALARYDGLTPEQKANRMRAVVRAQGYGPVLDMFG